MHKGYILPHQILLLVIMTQVLIAEERGKGHYQALVTDLTSHRFHQRISVRGRDLEVGQIRDLPVP